MRIALTFLTCDRADYSKRTLETLAWHNDLTKFVLIHGDDASKDDSGGELARSMGFRTMVQTRGTRRGVSKMTELLFQAALAEGATHVLNLQNDWESARPIPIEHFRAIFADENVYCLRLYGAMKSLTGRCGIHHGGREPRLVVEWKPHEFQYAGGALRGEYQAGDIHWGHPPAVTRITDAVWLTKGVLRESQSRKRSGRITRLTVRPIVNVFNHIGRERTPGFMA